jgi:hypothetical protein
MHAGCCCSRRALYLGGWHPLRWGCCRCCHCLCFDTATLTAAAGACAHSGLGGVAAAGTVALVVPVARVQLLHIWYYVHDAANGSC